MEKNNDQTILEMETEEMKDDVFKRRVELIKEIVVDTTMAQLEDPRTYQLAAGIGLWQGLKYKGDLGRGLKAGVAGLVVVTGCNVAANIVKSIDRIKMI